MSDKKKDSFYSKLCFALSLGFWIPLLNYPLSIISIIYGITALRLAHKEPERYGGRIYAAIGITLSCLPLIFGILVLVNPVTRDMVVKALLAQNTTLANLTG